MPMGERLEQSSVVGGCRPVAPSDCGGAGGRPASLGARDLGGRGGRFDRCRVRRWNAAMDPGGDRAPRQGRCRPESRHPRAPANDMRDREPPGRADRGRFRPVPAKRAARERGCGGPTSGPTRSRAAGVRFDARDSTKRSSSGGAPGADSGQADDTDCYARSRAARGFRVRGGQPDGPDPGCPGHDTARCCQTRTAAAVSAGGRRGGTRSTSVAPVG